MAKVKNLLSLLQLSCCSSGISSSCLINLFFLLQRSSGLSFRLRPQKQSFLSSAAASISECVAAFWSNTIFEKHIKRKLHTNKTRLDRGRSGRSAARSLPGFMDGVWRFEKQQKSAFGFTYSRLRIFYEMLSSVEKYLREIKSCTLIMQKFNACFELFTGLTPTLSAKQGRGLKLRFT